MNYTNTSYTPPKNASTGSEKTVVELRPKLGGFLFSYILFSLPGFFSGLIWLGIALLIVFGFLAGLVFGGDSTEVPTLSYQLVTDAPGTVEGVLVYDLQGVINTGDSSLPDSSRATGIYTEIVGRDFAAIKKDSKIKNIVFRVNTPGGSVFASEVLGDQIQDLLKSKNQKQAVFYFDQVVASGGLWAAYKNQDNYVVGSPYGDTGSIGVVLSVPNFRQLADNIGYSETVIKSGPSKDIGNPLRDLTQTEAAFLQKQIDEKYEQFVGIVATGRKLEPARVKEFANGYVYSNTEARNFGLLDDLGGLDMALNRAAKNAGLTGYDVYQVKTEVSPFGGLLAGTALGELAGASSQAAKAINKAMILEPGVVYAIDDTRI